MQKVITINLNGNAYQLEETAYGLLRVYLDGAELQLKDNPDKAEIISDLEQAIADKCNRVLGAQKTVVTTAEVTQIIDEMGPVEGTPGEPSSEKQERPRGEPAAPKRLYLIREGAMLGGVCKGLAAYFNIDVTIVRIVFIALAVVTKGAFVIAYLVLMVVIPYATTSEERAAAHGQPFNAQELIDEAKRNYAQFKDSRDWKRQWRRQRREWRRHVRPITGPWWTAPPPAATVGYAGQVVAGIMMPVLTVVRAVVFWLWLCVLASLLSTNALFGWPIPDDVPLWAAVLVAAVAYGAVAWPLHAARRASYYALGAHNYSWIAAWDGLLGFAVSVLCLWLAYQYVPEVHELADHLPIVRDNIQNFLRDVGLLRP
jgi:phage shock protein PspC (stress-responsive transcriptional regulator)